jgi:hypothetical protein
MVAGCARPSTATPGPSDPPASLPLPSAHEPRPSAHEESGPALVAAESTSRDAADDAPPSPREFAVDGWRIRLVDDGALCKLDYASEKQERRRLTLDLSPPCYLPLWQSSLPRKANAERTPVGADGQPMAWRYHDKGGETLALAVIGDPIPEMLRASERLKTAQREGYHCAGSAQGVLFRKDTVKTITKRNQVDIFCVEIPMEEASFWLTAHEPRK